MANITRIVVDKTKTAGASFVRAADLTAELQADGRGRHGRRAGVLADRAGVPAPAGSPDRPHPGPGPAAAAADGLYGWLLDGPPALLPPLTVAPADQATDQEHYTLTGVDAGGKTVSATATLAVGWNVMHLTSGGVERGVPVFRTA